jgi:hypothetical protein
MLTISKPTLFSSDNLATRGQCNHDSPGWQLRWFDRSTPPVLVWQGAFKTCRHLQANCPHTGSLEEVKSMVDEMLNTNSFTRFSSQPTDAYPSPKTDAGAPPGGVRKKRRKKKH